MVFVLLARKPVEINMGRALHDPQLLGFGGGFE